MNFLLKNCGFSGVIKNSVYLINEGIPQDDEIFYCNFFGKLRIFLCINFPVKVYRNIFLYYLYSHDKRKGYLVKTQ